MEPEEDKEEGKLGQRKKEKVKGKIRTEKKVHTKETVYKSFPNVNYIY